MVELLIQRALQPSVQASDALTIHMASSAYVGIELPTFLRKWLGCAAVPYTGFGSQDTHLA